MMLQVAMTNPSHSFLKKATDSVYQDFPEDRSSLKKT